MYEIWVRTPSNDLDCIKCSSIGVARCLWDALNASGNYKMLNKRP